MNTPRWLRLTRSKPVAVKRTRVRQGAYARSKNVRWPEWPKNPPKDEVFK